MVVKLPYQLVSYANISGPLTVGQIQKQRLWNITILENHHSWLGLFFPGRNKLHREKLGGKHLEGLPLSGLMEVGWTLEGLGFQHEKRGV